MLPVDKENKQTEVFFAEIVLEKLQYKCQYNIFKQIEER